MIENGSMIILATKDATYSPCKVISLSEVNIQVEYFVGNKKDKATGEFKKAYTTVVVPMKDVTQMAERP